MLQSRSYINTKKDIAQEEVSMNAQLLLRGGYVHKVSSGVYAFLPLGLRVLQNLTAIIRQEMNAVGGMELLMPSLHPRELWQETKRWDTMDDLYKVIDKQNHSFALGPTHEEVITDIVRKRPLSYKDLPLSLYQIQTKFRDEFRAKSGLLRGKEFLMKDMYSFHATEEDRKRYYEKVKRAYVRVYKRCGIIPLIAEASGGAFSKELSHEFQARTSAGEDVIISCQKCHWVKNREITEKKAGDTCDVCKQVLQEDKTIEIGNIFTLGTRFSSTMQALFTAQDGSRQPLIMGCYGMGLSRIIGACVEIHNDDRGIIWSPELAPFSLHIITIPSTQTKIQKSIQALLKRWQVSKNTSLLYDDRDVSVGTKFADADLIGAHQRIVISEKTIARHCVEIKKRSQKKAQLVSLHDIEKQYI